MADSCVVKGAEGDVSMLREGQAPSITALDAQHMPLRRTSDLLEWPVVLRARHVLLACLTTFLP